MKTFTRLLVTAGLVLGATALAFASPRSKIPTTLRTREESAQLKSGDAAHFVCNECTTVARGNIESASHAMTLCKAGSKVTCPMCRKDHKVVMKGRPAAKTPRHEAVYVNDEGKECFFIAAAVQTP